MRLSRLGLLLSGLYVLPSVACVAYAFLGANDGKGSFVFLQLPIALQGALLVELGLGPSMANWSWPLSYLLLAAPVAVLLYLAGAFISTASGTGGDPRP